MKNMVRLRFAPSPTGPLHIGGLRTALYNYLFAKKHKGSFILRIEDTDQARFIPQSEAYIMQALTWLGITPDEGPTQGGAMGPYRQSERKALYKQYALELVKTGKAYYAFDTPDELNTMRSDFKATGKISPQYNAITRMQMKNSFTLSQKEVSHKIATGEPYVIRMLIDPKITLKVKDKIRGWIQIKGEILDDKVLLKADGMATYHLANVVDDHFMQITHVIRGEEWLPSLAYHILLYQYLAWPAPEFVHLPLLLNADGKGKLSKRATIQGETLVLPLSWQDSATQQNLPGFREAGYLPEALLNFIALLGWHPSSNQELFTKEELIEHFSLSRISKNGACFDMHKAQWFNQKYLQSLSDSLLATRYLLPMLEKKGIDCTLAQATELCQLLKKGIRFPKELIENSLYFFHPPDEEVIKNKINWNLTTKAFLTSLAHALAELKNFNIVTLQQVIQNQITLHQLKIGEAMQLVRLVITGKKVGLPLAELLVTLGKDKALQRIQKILL